MRIAFLVRDDLKSISGGNIFNSRLIDHLRFEGDQVEVVKVPRGPFSPALYRKLSVAEYDLVLEDEMAFNSLGLLNRLLKKKKTISIVAVVHILFSVDDPAFREAEKGFLRSVDGMIFNSQDTKDHVERLLKGKSLSVLTYPGWDRFRQKGDIDNIRHKNVADGPLKIIFLGNLLKRKGFHYLLKALAKLPPGSWRLEAAGRVDLEKKYAAEVKRSIKMLGLERSVTLLGPLAGEAVAEIIQNHHLLVMPSLYEPFGIVYLEAMSFGLPVIASIRGGAREIIGSGQEGFLVVPDKIDALAEKIAFFLNNRGKITEMGMNAWKRSREFPRWSSSMKRARDFLVKVLK